ncbi:MAG: aminodeoxychorismate/anthranilate synthase component II [Saprospiraceae bacterium]|nr:aminodeoxychorismate/anthranilate synthase component II [Saprospiraceae bacterium]
MQKKVLIIDNYDSFTYNLVQIIEELLGYSIAVVRNDAMSVDEVNAFDILFLSPGPGVPKDAGILIDVIKTYAGKKPIFGVCLGLQAMAEAFGGALRNLSRVYHGVATPVTVIDSEEKLFEGISDEFEAGRYHSWVATKADLPDCFTVTAYDNDEQEIMAIAHNDYLLKAVQFHPESVLTPDGKKMIENFLIEAGAL